MDSKKFEFWDFDDIIKFAIKNRFFSKNTPVTSRHLFDLRLLFDGEFDDIVEIPKFKYFRIHRKNV